MQTIVEVLFTMMAREAHHLEFLVLVVQLNQMLISFDSSHRNGSLLKVEQLQKMITKQHSRIFPGDVTNPDESLTVFGGEDGSSFLW